MQKPASIFSLIQIHIKFIALLVFISFIIFGNSLQNEFAVVDDLAGFIENEQIRSIPKSLASFKLQEIVYSISYHFSQLNPLPLRILAVLNHAVVGSLLFLIILQLWNKKTAYIASLLFLVHPVTTETVNWVSAQFYIVMATFLFVSILMLIRFRFSGEKKYMYFIICIFALEILLIRHPWVFILPFAIIVIDLFLIEKKSSFQFYKPFLIGCALVILIYTFFQFSTQFSDRLEGRNTNGKVLQNQQSLIPVIQGYPYTIYNLMRLYIFPKDLTIYYDGNKITGPTYVLMYASFLVYIAGLYYSYKKNKRIFGLLILILVLILPVFSPKKLTWYITERYLYFGTGFFTTLVALFLLQIEKKYNWQKYSYIAACVIFVLYSIKTINRNTEWKTPETLAIATIKTSPYSVRPYNDLAGYYVLQNKYSDAKKYYMQALGVSSSLTATRNLGHIFLETGLDPQIKTLSIPVESLYAQVLRTIQEQEHMQALYYINEVLAQNPLHTDALNRGVEIYVLYEKYQIAEAYLNKMEELNLENADTFYIRAYLAYAKKDTDKATFFINKTLEINPNHPAALELAKHL